MKKSRSISGFTLIELVISTAIMSIVLGVVVQILGSVQRSYASQQELIQAQDNAGVALDHLVRLIRMAGNDPTDLNFQAIEPDPDANSVLDSIRLRSDWNPGDGDLNDRYEDVTFTASGGILYLQEPADAAPVAFLDGIGSIGFTYFDQNNNAVTDPTSNAGSIALAQITIQTQTSAAPATTFNSGASIRKRERQP